MGLASLAENMRLLEIEILPVTPSLTSVQLFGALKSQEVVNHCGFPTAPGAQKQHHRLGMHLTLCE